MNQHLRSGFGILILAVLSGIVWWAVRPPNQEPAYQSKPLRVWLRGFDAAQQSAEYAAAESAVRQIGTNALPILIHDLQSKDPPFYAQWIRVRSKLRLLHGEVNYSVFWHRRAAHACGALGEAAQAAFPALIEAMNDPGAAFDVGNGLSRMLPASAPVLTNILATGNVMARSRAADNLVSAFSHPNVEPMARTALIGALHDPDSGVRMSAASAFQFWNTHLELVVAALAEALGDSNASVRGNAVTSLGNLGGAAKSALPQVQALLQDTNRYVNGTVGDRAAKMLLKIDPEASRDAGEKP